jgi:hypothetical protein
VRRAIALGAESTLLASGCRTDPTGPAPRTAKVLVVVEGNETHRLVTGPDAPYLTSLGETYERERPRDLRRRRVRGGDAAHGPRPARAFHLVAP